MAKTTLNGLEKEFVELRALVIGMNGAGGMQQKLDELYAYAHKKVTDIFKQFEAYADKFVDVHDLEQLKKEVSKLSAIVQELKSEIRGEYQKIIEDAFVKAITQAKKNRPAFDPKEFFKTAFRYVVVFLLVAAVLGGIALLAFGKLTADDVAKIIFAVRGVDAQ